MAIIALASAVIIPRISNSDGKLYQVQLRTLTAVLNYNRRNAVIMNRPQNVKLYPYRSEKTVGEKTVSEANVSETDSAGEEQNLKAKTRSKKSEWRSQGADISWQSGIVKTHNRVIDIQYFPQGGATGGIITLQQGRFAARVNIDGMTGKTTLAENIRED